MSFRSYIAGARVNEFGKNEIVRCHECKHYYSYSANWGVCEYTRRHQEKALDVNPEHFCGWAERIGDKNEK